MNLRLMALNIREFVPVLSNVVIKQRINTRYKQLLGAEDWEFLSDSTTVNLKGIHSSLTGETIAMAAGVTMVTGTGTTLTDFTTGDLIRFGSEPQAYVVSVINSAVSLTMETAYGGATSVSSDYSIYRSVYSPSVANVGEITSIVYQSPLVEVTEDWLNHVDPERSSTGTPGYYRIFGKTKADGIVSFEIWPVPNTDYVVKVYYKKYVADLIEDTDEPVFRPELVEAGALWDCFRLAFAVTQNATWIGLARDARSEYMVLLRDALIADVATSSVSSRVKDTSGGSSYNDDYATDHDTEDWE